MAAWWPAGHIIGYEHTFTHQVADLVGDIAAGRQPRPLVRRRAAGPAGAGRGRTQLRRRRCLDIHPGPRNPCPRNPGSGMSRPVTLFTGQWADLPFEEVCRLAAGWGYDGLEIACWGDHLDPWRGAQDDEYIQDRLATLARHGLAVYAISNHLKGQAVCDDPIDARHEAMLSEQVWG